MLKVALATFPATGWTLTEWASPTLLEEGSTWLMSCLFFICAFSKMTTLEGSDCSDSLVIRTECALKRCQIKPFTL